MMSLETPQSTYVEPEYKESGMRNFMNLIRTTLNDYGVEHVQFNTVNKETLVAAQQHPEKYPTLMGPRGRLQRLLHRLGQACPGRCDRKNRAPFLDRRRPEAANSSCVCFIHTRIG